MRKGIVVLIALVLSQTNLFGQSWSVGLAGIYGDDIESGGIHLRGYYNLKGDKVCFGPEFSSFLKTTKTVAGETLEKSLEEVNFNLHYIFELNEKWGAYPLTGLNVSFEKEKVLASQSEHTQTDFGANLGFGLHRTLNNWMVFGEFDHLFGKASQNSILLGAFFTFGKSHEE